MKWSGKIGFAQDTEESAPSVFAERIVERSYYGDVLEFGRQMQGGDQINENVTIGNSLSVVADPFASANLYNLRYATFMGQRWKVSAVKVQLPRLVLTLGGLWNGNTPQP